MYQIKNTTHRAGTLRLYHKTDLY